MIDLTFLPKLMAVHTSATMSPGPNFAVVFKVATEEHSRIASIATATGVTLGIVLHAALALFGVSRVITAHPTALGGLKLVAALYLSYLGFLSFRGIYRILKENHQAPKSLAQDSAVVANTDQNQELRVIARQFFALGFMNCILNPKAFLYFMTVLPQGLSESLSAIQTFLTLVILGLITFVWFNLVAAIFQFEIVQRNLIRVKLGLSAVTGGLFVLLATHLWIDVLTKNS